MAKRIEQSKREGTPHANSDPRIASGKPLRSQDTRDRILREARRQFGEEGYDRTTIRSVALAADIHPSMVMRYYDSKEGLFASAASFDLDLPDLAKVPRNQLGKTMVRHFLQRWKDRQEDLPALLRVSMTHERARMRLFEILREQLTSTIGRICGKERAEACAALLATQTLGLALTRFVLCLPSVVALSEEVIVEHIGATLQNYLMVRPKSRGRTK